MALTEQQQRDLDQAVREWQGRFSPRRGYPASRKRIAPSTKAGFPTLAAPNAAPALGAGGMTGATASIGAGVTSVLVSARFSVPFRVHHFSINSNVGIAADVRYQFFVSLDSDTSGGFSTSGVPLDSQLGSALGVYAIRSFPIDAFPNFHQRTVPAWIKFVVFNNTAAAVVVHYLMSLHAL